jgi:hypothetical protein
MQNEPPDKIGTPWLVIKMYYASFYAAHCLLRIFGDSCSFFQYSQVNTLAKLYETSGRAVPFTLERGLYLCKLDASASSINCRKIIGGNGGSHEAFWDQFRIRIGELADSVLTAPLSKIEAQEIFSKLTALQGVMKQGGGSYSWLSYVRNEIQYRHQFDAWIPSSMKKVDRNILRRRAGQWTADPLAIDINVADTTLHKFISACAFIVACCRVILFRIASRSAQGAKSFLNVGPLSILKSLSGNIMRDCIVFAT